MGGRVPLRPPDNTYDSPTLDVLVAHSAVLSYRVLFLSYSLLPAANPSLSPPYCVFDVRAHFAHGKPYTEHTAIVCCRYHYIRVRGGGGGDPDTYDEGSIAVRGQRSAFPRPADHRRRHSSGPTRRDRYVENTRRWPSRARDVYGETLRRRGAP